MKNILLYIVIFFFISKVSGQTRLERKLHREQKSTKEYLETKKLLNTKTFVVKPSWVQPQGGTNININSDGYYLRISNDTIEMDLPYFGRVYSMSNSNSGGGISIDGIIHHYSISHNDEKRRSIIKLRTKNDSELFNITITVFKNGNTSVSVRGDTRNSINYQGKIIKEVES